MTKARRIGLIGGPAAFAVVLALPHLLSLPEGLSIEAVRMGAITVLVATWWVTEAIPIPATSLLPIVLMPTLGIMKSSEATKPYGHHLIYLFIGGFFLAKAIERWGLHRRIALHIIRIIGTSPNRLILGFMVATACLSMWVSNTATTMMMLPVALAVVSRVTAGRTEGDGEAPTRSGTNFAVALMLGIAYAASVGGVGTLIGTPPNAVMAGIVEQRFGQTIGFARWMAFGVPFSAVFLGVTWFLLTRVLHRPEIATIPGGKALVREELARMGPMSRAERRVLVVFLAVALGWVARGFLHTTMVADATIAMAGGVALFLVPSGEGGRGALMDWATAVTIPWGVVVLFGGGLALAAGIDATGLAHWAGGLLASISSRSMLPLMVAVVLSTIFLTELTSNTATAALLVPLMGSTAVAMSVHPFGLMVSSCVAASCAFMLPVATPPNAVVYGSGHLTISQMARAGVWMNLIGTVLILLFSLLWLPIVWGIDLDALPHWAVPAN